jgi:diguanylate cyclase (GGDEF)-like protein/PAS domain S-box-containing protein
VDERTRLDPSGWAGVERIALSTAGVLTAAFGLAVLIGGSSSVPLLRDIHEAWPSVSPALALWLLVAGVALVALGATPEALSTWTRDLRFSAPRQTLVLSAAALATVLATCVALAHGDSERDQRHTRLLSIAENDMRHATVGPIDRLTDVASTVQGPLSVRRPQFDALAKRLLTEPALTSVALARSAGGPAPARAGTDDAPGRPQRYKIVFSRSRGRTTASRDAVELPAGRAALEGAIRSGETRATQLLPAVDGSPPSIAVAVPVRPSSAGASGAFLTTFSAQAVRAAVAAHLPERLRFAVSEGDAPMPSLHNAKLRHVKLGDREWSLALEEPAARQGLALATLLVGGLLTILIAVVGSQALRRERDALGLIAVRRDERDRAELARRAAEERSRVLAETSTDLICVLAPSGALRYASPACRELLGAEPDDLLGRPFVDLVHPEDAVGVTAVLGASGEREDPVSFTHRMRRAGGPPVWVETRVRVVRDPVTRAVVESHATVRDVAERMHSQAALAEAEERFRSAFEEAPIGMALTSPDFRFLRVNRALCQITGYTPSQLEGLPVASITHPDDLKADWQARGAMLEGELSSHRAERRYLHASGSAVWVMINSTLVRDADGVPLHFLSQMQDITERRRHEAELRHMADHDPLTGLLNRRSFERELERHVAYVQRYGPKGAAIVLDLDHFKTVNDTLGHSAGDELIVRVAHALRSRLRESDVLARLGGDEFAILLPEASHEEADGVAIAVLDAVRTLAVPTATGRTRTVTASLGMARFDSGQRLSGEDVLVNADLAMYDAKESGRDQLAAYAAPEQQETRLEARISWADMIRDALAEDRFVLHAQPIVDLDTGDVTQYELLLRMRDPDGDLISPAAFLPVAERFDLMAAIDRWVVTRAIQMVGAERRRGRDLVVEVNISGRSAGDPELLELIERELASADVDPHQIIFEITETIAVSNIPRAQHFAARLADLGCRFALDDFGAGFGSFYYLKHLPFDYLKIDGEFVRHSAVDATDQLVIQAVVDIARGLGKRTIAEHVGDRETAALLRRMGVDHAQGFHHGEPAPLGDWLPEPDAFALS